MSDEWISISTSMPPVDREIEVRKESGKVEKTILRGVWGNPYNNITFYYKGIENAPHDRVMHYRIIPEKRPDFSKLMRGDILAVEFIDNDEILGCTFRGIRADIDAITLGDAADHRISYIKKITRINLEKQTFEEI